jgi:hypothetical protein
MWWLVKRMAGTTYFVARPAQGEEGGSARAILLGPRSAGCGVGEALDDGGRPAMAAR